LIIKQFINYKLHTHVEIFFIFPTLLLSLN